MNQHRSLVLSKESQIELDIAFRIMAGRLLGIHLRSHNRLAIVDPETADQFMMGLKYKDAEDAMTGLPSSPETTT